MNSVRKISARTFPALGQVQVFDNMIAPQLQKEILGFVRRPIWAYGWKSIKDHDRYGFWHAHFAGGDENELDDCGPALEANTSALPIQRLWKFLEAEVLEGHVPVRVYANGHTYGVEGYIHTDSSDANYFTTIYYAHGVWDANWAGETVFYSQDTGDIAHSINPKPGRLIVFRGATPHVARSPSRECPELRISVVIKTRLRADAT